MTLPLSRFALALALAAMATLGVVAQTPDESAVDGAAADAQEAVDTAADAVADAAPPADPPPPADSPADAVADPAADATVEAEAAADVPAEPVVETTEPAPVTEAEVAEVTEVPEAAAPVEESVVVTPAEPAVVIEPTPSVVVEAAPAPAGPVCCPLNVVDYRTTLSAKRAYRCYGPGVNTAVCIDNPADCTCTQYQVNLCVPACCTGAPRVCPSTGLFGRGKVDLVWDCGFTATVVFRAHGGAIVIYQG
jgi:hypothetical protein